MTSNIFMNLNIEVVNLHVWLYTNTDYKNLSVFVNTLICGTLNLHIFLLCIFRLFYFCIFVFLYFSISLFFDFTISVFFNFSIPRFLYFCIFPSEFPSLWLHCLINYISCIEIWYLHSTVLYRNNSPLVGQQNLGKFF